LKIEQLPGRSQKRKSLAVFAAVLVAAVLAAGCAEDERAVQGQPDGDETTAAGEQTGTERTAGQTTGLEGEGVEDEAARTEPEERVEGAGGKERAREVRLRIGGDPGTAFSGTCAVGDEEEEVSGEVPRSFTYRLDRGKLKCEITNDGPGALEVVLKSGNDRSVHRTNAPEAVINLTYSENGVSSSTTSSSSSVNQQSSSSSRSSR